MSAEIETAEPASTALVRTTAVPTPEQRVDAKPRSRGLITGGLTLAVVSFSVAAPVGTLAVAPQATDGEIAFAQVDLCAGLGAAEIARLERVLTRREHPNGSALYRRGDGGDELFVLLKGAVSLSIRAGDPATGARRLLTLHSGVTFGEMALLEGKPRSADALFDVDSVTVALSRAAFGQLTQEHPQLANKLLLALARILSSHLRATTEELRELER